MRDAGWPAAFDFNEAGEFWTDVIFSAPMSRALEMLRQGLVEGLHLKGTQDKIKKELRKTRSRAKQESSRDDAGAARSEHGTSAEEAGPASEETGGQRAALREREARRFIEQALGVSLGERALKDIVADGVVLCQVASSALARCTGRVAHSLAQPVGTPLWYRRGEHETTAYPPLLEVVSTRGHARPTPVWLSGRIAARRRRRGWCSDVYLRRMASKLHGSVDRGLSAYSCGGSCDAVQVSQSLKNGSVKRVRHSELWEDHAANLLDASNVKCLSVLLFCLLRLFSLTSLRLLCGPCWRSSVIRKQAEAQAWVKMGLSAEDAYEPIDVTTADGMIRVVTLPPAPVEAPVVLPRRHSALCRQSARHDRHSPGADVAAAYFGAQVDAILRLKHACAPLLKRLLQKREQGQREQEQRAAVEREAMEEVGTREYPCVTVSTRVTLAAV